MNNNNNINPEENDYCWNTIGIGAAVQSCPKLKDFIHCRNCDVFKSKASLLLEMQPDAGYLAEWTSFLEDEKNEDEKSGESVFIFRLEKEWLALPTLALKEVSAPSKIHKIPHKSDNVLLGMVNIRGVMQLCFSFKAFIGIEASSEAEQNDSQNLFGIRFVVLEKGNFTWVFPVDEILDIYKYDIKKTMNIPLNVSNASATYTKTVFQFQDRIVGYLDDELIISALKRRLQ